jgi:hypothetical protein
MLYFEGKDCVLEQTIKMGETSCLFVQISWWVLWRPFCKTNHNIKDFASRLLLATLFKDAHDYWRSYDICQAYAQRCTMSAPLGPFEKWGVDLMGPLLVTSKWHWFIVVVTYYLIKFVEVRVLKSLVKQEVVGFWYEQLFTQFGTSFEIISDNGP